MFRPSQSGRLLLLPILFAISCLDPDAPPPGVSVVDHEAIVKYLEAMEAQRASRRAAVMDVVMAAELPKLKKSGRLEAVRHVWPTGRISYEIRRLEGDNTVKKEVIARFLAAETGADAKPAPPITPQYYRFKYKGLVEKAGRAVHLVQLTPRKKLSGTFQGELWLDDQSYLPVREAGRLVKNPSVFIKRFEFERTYEIREGMAVPKETFGTVETRLWGAARMHITFQNFAVEAEPVGQLPSEAGDLVRTP